MGFDWPFSPLWFCLGILFFALTLFFHGRSLLRATVPGFAWKLIVLRAIAGLIFLLLIVRPYWETNEPDTNEFRLLTLSDLSGSMDVRDERSGPRRIEQVQPHLNLSLIHI